MSKQFLIGSLFLAFVSGIGLGLFMGGASSSSDTSTNNTSSSSTEKASASEEELHSNDVLKARVAELEKELADQKKDQDSLILEDRLNFLKKHIKGMGLRPFDDNLKITPTMADFLKLSPQQQQLIEQHLAQIQEETQKLEDAKMVLVKQSANGVSYEIPLYPEGDEIKAKLVGLLNADMGEERTDLFMQTSPWQFASQFSCFGETQTNLEITRTDQNGTPSYTLTESYTGGPMTGASVTHPLGNSLPPRWQKLIQLAPGQ